MQGDRIAWELGRKKIPINRKCNRNLGFPGGSDGEESAYNAGDLGSILEMKISSAISINKKCHGHQQFLASKCEWELTKLRSRWRCHAPCWLLRSWGKARSKVRKETGLAQTPEVHMKRMNSMSPEACILPSCSVQLLSCIQFFVTPWTAAPQASLSITQLPEPTQTHVHAISDAIQPSHPLSSPAPPAFNLSQHQGLYQ